MPRTKSLPQYAFKPTSPGYPLLEVQRIQQGHVLHRMPPHSHHYLEFLYFERPSGHHRVGTYTKTIEAGSLFVIAPGEIHDARAMGNAEGWVVMFTPDAVEPGSPRLSGFFQWLSHPLFLPFLRPMGINNSSFRTQLSNRARWTTQLFALERELNEAGFAFREAAGALLRLMLVDIARLVDPRIRETLPHRTAFLERVFAFIEAQYAQSLRMTDLAAHVNGTTILRGDAEVPVLATPGVDATLREIDGPKRAFWMPIYGEDYPPVTTFPNRLVHDGDTVTFDGVNIRVLDMGAGEGAFETVFVLEEQNIAFIGDVAYNHFHVWLAEGRSSAWLKQLDKLRPKLEGLRVLYPGHGKPGDASILAWQRAYLEAFRAAVQDLADGQATLDEAGKTELTRRMEAFDPQAPLLSWVAYGADPVAAELADDDA